MEIFSMDFLAALAAIVVIDLVLAGDNAIVIALAARNLPPHLRKRAIVWGTVGAVAVRSLMTMAVVWLLRIPGLLMAGGALLVWIAYKLLRPADGNAGEDAKPADSFWAALRTIVVADLVMGLDNVLAVAGAGGLLAFLLSIGATAERGFFEPLQRAGGTLNGSTSADRTNYWEVVPTGALELALWMEADRMGWLLPALSEERFNTQREVVLNERRQSYENRPYGLASFAMLRAMHQEGHPYRWPVIGDPEIGRAHV